MMSRISVWCDTADTQCDNALVAQRIEHRPPKPVAQVRFLPGAPLDVLLPRNELSRYAR